MILNLGLETAGKDQSEEADQETDIWTEEQRNLTKIEILTEEKEDALIVVKEVIKLETADKRDIHMVEEIKDLDLEAGQDQDPQVMEDIVEEDHTEVEIEAMKIQEAEEDIKVEEMIIVDNHLIAEATAMRAEEMEKSIQEIVKIKTIVVAEIKDQNQDIVIKKKDREIINLAVKKESMDHKNPKAIDIKEAQEVEALIINNLEVEVKA